MKMCIYLFALFFLVSCGGSDSTVAVGLTRNDPLSLATTIEQIRQERAQLYKMGAVDGSGFLYQSTKSYRRAMKTCDAEQLKALDRALGPPSAVDDYQ